jgi:hypothetical protein
MIGTVSSTARRRAKRALAFVGVGFVLAVGVAPAQASSSSHGGGPAGTTTGHKVG